MLWGRFQFYIFNVFFIFFFLVPTYEEYGNTPKWWWYNNTIGCQSDGSYLSKYYENSNSFLFFCCCCWWIKITLSICIPFNNAAFCVDVIFSFSFWINDSQIYFVECHFFFVFLVDVLSYLGIFFYMFLYFGYSMTSNAVQHYDQIKEEYKNTDTIKDKWKRDSNTAGLQIMTDLWMSVTLKLQWLLIIHIVCKCISMTPNCFWSNTTINKQYY